MRVGRLSVEDIERGGPRICQNLRVFAAQFDIGVAIDDDDDQRRHRQVFERIATLVEIEKLTVGAVDTEKAQRLQFHITHGLDALSGLKSLYSLNVVETKHLLVLSDIRWMNDTWPRHHIVIERRRGSKLSPRKIHGFKGIFALKKRILLMETDDVSGLKAPLRDRTLDIR